MTPVTTPLDGKALYLRAMGVTVESEAEDDESLERMTHQWARAVVARDAETGLVVTGPPARAGLPEWRHNRDYLFATQVTLAALQATAGERVNLHAGGLADDRGRVLAIVGPSGTGKTTATRSLAAVLHYLSDETVSVTPDLVVYPHPKPLSVLVSPGVSSHKEQLSPDDLGLLSTPESGILTRIVLLHRGVPDPRGLRPIDTVSALMELIEQSSSLGQLPTPLPTLMHLVHECGGALVLEYDEIADHVEDLVRLLEADRPPVTDEVGVHHPGAGSGAPEPEDDGSDPRVRRAPWTDALELGEDLIVLLQDRALHLNGLPATIWLHLDQPRTLEELVERTQHVHGMHPDAISIVRHTVGALVEESLAAGGSLA